MDKKTAQGGKTKEGLRTNYVLTRFGLMTEAEYADITLRAFRASLSQRLVEAETDTPDRDGEE